MNSETPLPLVTVIIPVYNHEQYIETALRSVFAQTYKPLEVIVVDDGSKDKSREVIHSLQAEFVFCYIENEKNLGLTKSLNLALKVSKGEYISILAGDDCWVPEKTAIQVPFMEANPKVAACSGNVKKIDGKGNSYHAHTDRKVKSIAYRNFEDCMTLRARFPAIVTLIRKDVLIRVGGYDENFIMEDLPLWLRLTSTGWKIAVLPEQLGYYRIHSTPISLSNSYGKMFDNYVNLFGLYRNTSYYNKAMRALYSRQMKFGPYRGWGFLLTSIRRGFAFEWEYFRNLVVCSKKCARHLFK